MSTDLPPKPYRDALPAWRAPGAEEGAASFARDPEDAVRPESLQRLDLGRLAVTMAEDAASACPGE